MTRQNVYCIKATMANRRRGTTMAMRGDSVHADTWPGDMEFQNASIYIYVIVATQKEKEKKEYKPLGMSAACSEEAAGCQTLKQTGAEFNASCQRSLMWLLPPAKAGIVKLSGAAKDAPTALRDAPFTVPTLGTSLWKQQGGETHPPSLPRKCGCVHEHVCEFCSPSASILLML